ncbi:MAG TPA: HEPN domain-containing protein, partial [Dehalococcoidia bacterium]|nr:HEPN domain-containing protein [Dehalococcoidia bacterium]
TSFAVEERALLERVRSAVRAVEPGAQVILYGSRARSDSGPESDWDLLILVDGAARWERQKALWDCLNQLELDTGQCISAILRDREGWDSPRSRITPFHANVEDDGIDLDTLKPAPRGDPTRFTEAQMAEAREEAVAEWMERAHRTLEEAALLAQNGSWHGCVNRLYYACFDAVRALLLQRGYRFSRHSSVQSLFNRDFVHTGLVAGGLGDLYNMLFKQRGYADYVAFVRFDEASVRAWIAESERFIQLIQSLVASAPNSIGPTSSA